MKPLILKYILYSFIVLFDLFILFFLFIFKYQYPFSEWLFSIISFKSFIIFLYILFILSFCSWMLTLFLVLNNKINYNKADIIFIALVSLFNIIPYTLSIFFLTEI